MKDLFHRMMMVASFLATLGLGLTGCASVDTDDHDHPPPSTTVIEHHHHR